jgi:pimeloyl-ACP methyl ester carboxylesterase
VRSIVEKCPAVLGWQSFVRERERRLALEGDPVKFAHPAAVGLEYLERGAGAGDLPQLVARMRGALRNVDAFFAPDDPGAFERQGSRLVFASPSAGEGPNSLARAQLYEARQRERAVVLLPYWNAAREDCRPFGAALARAGVTCLQLSLPYHDERATPGTGFARELVCENLGLTIRSNRQAVLDARACLAWLEQQGYRRIGIVGVSIGAAIASIVAALDERVRAAALILTADDFADVVWTGSATQHVRRALEQTFTREEVRTAWSIISPASHAARLSARLERLLVVSGDIDTVVLPEQTHAYVERLRAHGLRTTWIRYRCGHYTLGLPLYAGRCFLRCLSFFYKFL